MSAQNPQSARLLNKRRRWLNNEPLLLLIINESSDLSEDSPVTLTVWVIPMTRFGHYFAHVWVDPICKQLLCLGIASFRFHFCLLCFNIVQFLISYPQRTFVRRTDSLRPPKVFVSNILRYNLMAKIANPGMTSGTFHFIAAFIFNKLSSTLWTFPNNCFIHSLFY